MPKLLDEFGMDYVEGGYPARTRRHRVFASKRTDKPSSSRGMTAAGSLHFERSGRGGACAVEINALCYVARAGISVRVRVGSPPRKIRLDRSSLERRSPRARSAGRASLLRRFKAKPD